MNNNTRVSIPFVKGCIMRAKYGLNFPSSSINKLWLVCMSFVRTKCGGRASEYRLIAYNLLGMGVLILVITSLSTHTLWWVAVSRHTFVYVRIKVICLPQTSRRKKIRKSLLVYFSRVFGYKKNVRITFFGSASGRHFNSL